MEQLYYRFRNKKEFGALERILTRGDVRIELDNLKRIIEAHKDYEGNALRASVGLKYGVGTIVRYWRMAGFEIKFRGHPDLPQEEIQRIENAHSAYKRNALLASKNLGHSIHTIIKYWRGAGLRTNKRGYGKDEKLYKKYKQLIEMGYNQNEIASILNITRQGVSYYIHYHNLTRPKNRRGKTG